MVSEAPTLIDMTHFATDTPTEVAKRDHSMRPWLIQAAKRDHSLHRQGVRGSGGPRVRGSGVAGSGVAGSGVAGSGVAGSGVAGLGVAGLVGRGRGAGGAQAKDVNHVLRAGETVFGGNFLGPGFDGVRLNLDG